MLEMVWTFERDSNSLPLGLDFQCPACCVAILAMLSWLPAQ